MVGTASIRAPALAARAAALAAKEDDDSSGGKPGEDEVGVERGRRKGIGENDGDAACLLAFAAARRAARRISRRARKRRERAFREKMRLLGVSPEGGRREKRERGVI